MNEKQQDSKGEQSTGKKEIKSDNVSIYFFFKLSENTGAQNRSLFDWKDNCSWITEIEW